MNSLPLILAEVTNWPGAVANIATALIAALAVCVFYTGEWPWKSGK
jgi:hypothetical protein